MPGTAMKPLLAVIAIPSMEQWLWVVWPVLAVLALRALAGITGLIVEHLFPHWEWEKKLGWLNITADRHSDAILRWIGYFIHAGLAVALYGIVWGAPALDELGSTDPTAIGDGASRLAALTVSIAIWALYLGGDLIPRLRREHEQEELARYRAEHPDFDEEEIAAERRSAKLTNKPLLSPKTGSRR